MPSRISRVQDTVIIGGGFTGTTTAAQLLRHGLRQIVVVERNGLPGRGIAFGTRNRLHLLNVPAGNMGAFPDDAQDFFRWARLHYDPGIEPSSFLPRYVYGQYVEWILQRAIAGSPQESLLWLNGEVISIEKRQHMSVVRLSSGAELLTHRIVLCLGNFRPMDPLLPGRMPDSRRYVSFPWSESAISVAKETDCILLVGSGLTSLDLVLALRGRGVRGTIHVVSRRGQLPQSHNPASSWPILWDSSFPRGIRALTRLVREQIVAAEERGIDWRAVIDSLRPAIQRIWQELDVAERRRFLRHVRSYWEVHRHRVPPLVATAIAEEMSKGQMQLHAGRITRYHEDDNFVTVTYQDRRSGRLETVCVNWVINCTGPDADYRCFEDALIKDMIAKGLARPDPLFLGLDVSATGALIDAHGRASSFLYALGPVRKGHLWETTAVPEIRAQVTELTRLFTSQQRRGISDETENRSFWRQL